MNIAWSGDDRSQWEACLRKFGLQLDSRLLFGQLSAQQQQPVEKARDRRQNNYSDCAGKEGLA